MNAPARSAPSARVGSSGAARKRPKAAEAETGAASSSAAVVLVRAPHQPNPFLEIALPPGANVRVMASAGGTVNMNFYNTTLQQGHSAVGARTPHQPNPVIEIALPPGANVQGVASAGGTVNIMNFYNTTLQQDHSAQNENGNTTNSAAARPKEFKGGSRVVLQERYNNSMTEAVVVANFGKTYLELLKSAASSCTSVHDFYLLLVRYNKLGNKMLLDLFPMLDMPVTANLYYLACLCRSCYRLAQPGDVMTDQKIINDFSDKQFYEAMRQRLNRLKSFAESSAGPILIREMKRGIVLKPEGQIEINHRVSPLFPIDKNSKFVYSVSPECTQGLALADDDNVKRYRVHGAVMNTVLASLDHLLDDSGLKNLCSLMKKDGVTMKEFNQQVSPSRFALVVTLLIVDREDSRLYNTSKAILKAVCTQRELVEQWGGFENQTFDASALTMHEHDDYTRQRLGLLNDDAPESDDDGPEVAWDPSHDDR